MDEAVEYPQTTYNRQLVYRRGGREGGGGEGRGAISPCLPPKPKLAGGTTSGLLPAAGTTWIIVFLGGGWWSALLSKGW